MRSPGTTSFVFSTNNPPSDPVVIALSALSDMKSFGLDGSTLAYSLLSVPLVIMLLASVEMRSPGTTSFVFSTNNPPSDPVVIALSALSDMKSFGLDGSTLAYSLLSDPVTMMLPTSPETRSPATTEAAVLLT